MMMMMKVGHFRRLHHGAVFFCESCIVNSMEIMM